MEAPVVRRRALSSDRAGETGEEGVKRRGSDDKQGQRPRPVSLVRTLSMNVDSALAGEIFDHFCNAGTLKSILRSYRYLCEVLRLKPNQLPYFYPKLKAKLKTWKAAALWTKLDKRAAQKVYNRGKACQGTRVLVIGAGPCGLRSAIEAQLLGAKVVVVEKRDRYSRNNVLHLWPYNIQELRGLGAKKFYGKFCAGAIDHISIRQLQCILLKVCLLFGVEIFEGVSFEELVEPVDIETGWKARVLPGDHPVGQYEFDVLIGADGKRNTLTGFKRKEFRGKLAIAITANLINKHTEAEGRVEEISGVAFIFNQKFFNDLNEELGISLENVVYYKDETHYFVMTAKKQSLLNKGVLINNHTEPSALLASENISQEALFQYAREAADFATKGQLPHLDFAVNHYGKPDVSMFDFTSMYAADHSARVIERHGHRLLQCLVGDSLLEPFWPTGTGIPRGFFSAMDAMWLMRQMESGKMTVLECLAERESIYRILSQTTPENCGKDFGSYSLDPNTRYPHINLKLVLPFQVTQCYDTDNPAHLQPQNVLQDSAPRKRRRKESHVNPGTLMTWLQKQLENYNLEVTDMTSSFQNGLALCAIIHRYRPDLIDFTSLDPSDIALNNQLAFDILECELGVPPLTTGQEVAVNAEAGRPPDKLAMISYLTQVYELFRKEIPYILQQEIEQEVDDLDDSVYCHNHKAGRERKEERKVKKKDIKENVKTIGQLVASDAGQRKQKKRSMDSDDFQDVPDKYKATTVSNKKRLAKLMERAALQEKKRQEKLENSEPKNIKNEERYKIIEQQFMGGPRKRAEGSRSAKKPGDLKRAIGRIDSGDWNVRQIEERLKENKNNGSGSSLEKVPKWSKEAFNDKLAKVKCNLELTEDKKQIDIDASLAKLQKKLREGSALETGERGANKVSALVGELVNKLGPGKTEPSGVPELRREPSQVWVPPVKPPGSGKSDNCLFCAKKVYVVERMSAEGKFFHRACFRCDYCNILLRLGSYVYNREGHFAGKFFCIPHSTEKALEKYKYKKKIDEIHAQEMRRKESTAKREEKNKIKNAISPSNRDRLMEPELPGRGTTPERVEYEASIDLSAEESGLEQQIDEDEWTDRNFGNSTAADVNTSDDSISDLESDCDEGVRRDGGLVSGKIPQDDRPLTADETRRLAREWRSRFKGGSDGSGSDLDGDDSQPRVRRRVVEFSDQEYEEDSDSDCEDIVLKVPKLPGRSARRRMQRSPGSSGEEDLSSDELTSDYSSTDDGSSSDDCPELRDIERLQNKKNPFTQVPKIVVQPNSPVPPSVTNKPTEPGYPNPSHIAQKIPLGPTPFGTALYQPSLSSLSKYQYKTPALSSSPNSAMTHRTLSGIMSNNLKKNWVTPASGPPTSTPRKVDQSEIDARLKSLMDRLSNQQSLLKPADKPSVQMQHYLDQRKKESEENQDGRKLSNSRPFVPYKPSIIPQEILNPKQKSPEEVSTKPPDDITVKEDGTTTDDKSVVTNGKSVETGEDHDTDTVDSDSDSSDSGSITTEVSECEQRNHEPVGPVPEIRINLAEPEPDLSESLDTTPDKSDIICDTKLDNSEEHIDFIDTNDSESPDSGNDRSCHPIDHPSSSRNPPKRRPSLLRTVVSIKNDQPVTVVNYTETLEKENKLESPQQSSPDKRNSLPDDLLMRQSSIDDSFQTVNEDIDTSKENFQSFTSAMDSSVSLFDASMSGMDSSTGTVECFNNILVNKTDDLPLPTDRLEEKHDTMGNTNYENSESCANTSAVKKCNEYNSKSVDIHDNNIDECGNLLIVDTHAIPQQVGENESNTEHTNGQIQVPNGKGDGNFVYDIYKVKNANEKMQRLTNHQQHQSNMIHDLIIGKTKQRRTRQPRVIATVSSVPLVPKYSPENSPLTKLSDHKIGDSIGDLAMIDDDEQSAMEVLLREKSVSRQSLREGSIPRSIRERSNSRSIREGSPQVTLPPTPITNPEKFGIKIKTETELKKDYRQAGSMRSLISPTESAGSNDMTDNLDGIVSTDTDSAPLSSPVGRSCSSLSQGKTKGKGGFMAAVAGIFRTSSPSPVSSPNHSNKQSVRREDSFLGRWTRREPPGVNKKKSDLAMTSPSKELSIKTANLSLQASHPSTPPVPLSRRIKLGSQPPQASEDSFSDEEEDISEGNGINSSLPRDIKQRLEKRLTKEGRRTARQAGSARVRRAQEIQRELEVIEVDCVRVEEKGVELEQRLREEPELVDTMSQWFRLLGDKNKLVRREQELMVGSKHLELQEQAEKLESELGAGQLGTVREGDVLESLVKNAEQRELLTAMLLRDQERYRQEDKDLALRMAEQGIK